eukprot:992527-Amphidinium_carterae.1
MSLREQCCPESLSNHDQTRHLGHRNGWPPHATDCVVILDYPQLLLRGPLSMGLAVAPLGCPTAPVTWTEP